MHVRVCRDCGEEYRPDIAVCADCGGELEDRHEEQGGPASRARPAAPIAPPPPDLSGHRPLFTTGQARLLVPLAEALRASGTFFVIHETPADERHQYATFSLLVREEDAERALRMLAPLLAAEGDAPERLHAVETAFRSEGGYERCPACETALPADARECPECGLGLAGEAEPGTGEE